MTKDISKLEDLTPDDRNLNRGTKRGLELLEASLQQHGAGRSILADKNGRVIAGNKTLQQAVEMGLGVVVVKTDGKALVVVQREDVDLDTNEGRALALADNRVSEVDLDWDGQELKKLMEDGLDVSEFFFPEELEKLLAEDAPTGAPELPAGDKAPFRQASFVLHDKQHALVEQALKLAKAAGPFTDGLNENGNGNALARICAAYLAPYLTQQKPPA